MSLVIRPSTELSQFRRGGGPLVRALLDLSVPGEFLPRLSRRARSGGEVAIGILYVTHESQDVVVMSHVGLAVTEPPAADGVEVTLFEVSDLDGPYRYQAVAYLEQYTTPGQRMDWAVFNGHVAGSRTLRLWGPRNSDLPSIGQSIFLRDESIGGTYEQPFRIIGLSSEERIWNVDSQSAISYIDLLLTLSAPLDEDVDGTTPDYALTASDIVVRKGQVGAGARFHGVATLAAPVTLGVTTELQVDSVYASVVPAAEDFQSLVEVAVLPQVARSVVSGAGYSYTDTAGPAHSSFTLVTEANRSLQYTDALSPRSVVGTVRRSYVALGEWYDLDDNGDGTIGGPGQGGFGTYTANTLAVTLEHKPDIDTYMVTTWGSDQQFERLDAEVLAPAIVAVVLDAGSTPATLTLNWTAGGAAKSATDDGSGLLSGDASGSYGYGLGLLRLQAPLLPDGDIHYELTRGAATFSGPAASPVISGGRVTWTTDDSLPITPGSADVWMYVTYQWPGSVDAPHGGGQVRHHWIDQGNGTLKPLPGLFAGYDITLNYATGEFSAPELIPNFTSALRWTGSAWVGESLSARYKAGNTLEVSLSGSGGADSVSGTLVAGSYGLTLDLPPGDPVEPGSVVLSFGGQVYTADAAGALTGSVSGAGAGTVSAGLILISAWTGGAGNAPAWLAGLRRGGEWTATDIAFRVPGTNVQPGSLSVTGLDVDGGAVSATTDNAGVVGGDATGVAKFTEGFAQMAFATPVQPASLKQSAVLVQRIPLEADVIGIDPSRLPADGTVPKFHAGGQVAVGDSTVDTLPSGLVAGQVEALSQNDLASITLYDADGKTRVDDALYIPHLADGEVEMADPLDLSAYIQPLKAKLCWYDQTTVVDVQANGRIHVTDALPRSYATGTARVFSILEFGNLGAHVDRFFDQKVWTGEFVGELVGDQAPFTYNVSGFPIETRNDRTPTERWAVHVKQTTPSLLVDVIGERMGNLGEFDASADISPVDPATSEIVWTLRAAGGFAGAQPGNVLRFDTIAAAHHACVLRATNIGAQNLADDEAVLSSMGDL